MILHYQEDGDIDKNNVICDNITTRVGDKNVSK